MKLDQQSRNNLHGKIKKRLSEKGINIATLARAANVDPGQASRICRGNFRTMSYNVVRICNVLEVDTSLNLRDPDQLDGRLIAGLMELWDGTPEDSARLSQFLLQLANFRYGFSSATGLSQRALHKPVKRKRRAVQKPRARDR